MRKALENLLAKYVRLAESGDCGNWDPELESEVIAARVALAGRKDHITGLQAKIKAQAQELTAKDKVLANKTAQLTALGHVWCTACGDVPSEESITIALLEVERMVTRYVNAKYKERLQKMQTKFDEKKAGPAEGSWPEGWVDHGGRNHRSFCLLHFDKSSEQCCCHTGPVDPSIWFACCCPALSPALKKEVE
jgi:hypothetical protein